MREKSHKGQRHKGCGLCDVEKRAGNGASRRPYRDRRWLAWHQDPDALETSAGDGRATDSA